MFSGREAHATLNRRTVLTLVNCAARSGSAFFKAVVSMRLLVTGFHTAFQLLPVRVSTPAAVISALMAS